MQMWEQPPRLAQSDQMCALAKTDQPDDRKAGQQQRWQAERVHLLERISELETQQKELQESMQEQARARSSTHSKQAMRAEILMAEISDLEARLDKSEAAATRHRQRADSLAQILQNLRESTANKVNRT